MKWSPKSCRNTKTTPVIFVGSDQDRLENSYEFLPIQVFGHILPSVRANTQGTQEKWPPVVLKLWQESTIDPGLGASDLLKGHFQGLDEVPGILISWPSKVEIKKKKHLKKKTYKILGGKHQKARIPWKSWDSGIKNLCPYYEVPLFHAIWS